MLLRAEILRFAQDDELRVGRSESRLGAKFGGSKQRNYG
jgi:hypothetical protein